MRIGAMKDSKTKVEESTRLTYTGRVYPYKYDITLEPCPLSAPASCIVHKKVISHLNSQGEKLIANSKSPQFCKLNNRQRERERERERKEKTCMKTRGINLYTLSRNYFHD
jgi:hypothetical protein